MLAVVWQLRNTLGNRHRLAVVWQLIRNSKRTSIVLQRELRNCNRLRAGASSDDNDWGTGTGESSAHTGDVSETGSGKAAIAIASRTGMGSARTGSHNDIAVSWIHHEDAHYRWLGESHQNWTAVSSSLVMGTLKGQPALDRLRASWWFEASWLEFSSWLVPK